MNAILACKHRTVEIHGKDIERFHRGWQQDSNSDCRIWQKWKSPKGYGQIRINGVSALAHRISYAICFGDPGSLCVLHSCDNPSCVFPGHLFRGTNADNTADMVNKKRHLVGEAHPDSKLCEAEVVEIKKLYTKGDSVAQITKLFDVKRPTINDIIQNKTWKHLQKREEKQ